MDGQDPQEAAQGETRAAWVKSCLLPVLCHLRMVNALSSHLSPRKWFSRLETCFLNWDNAANGLLSAGPDSTTRQVSTATSLCPGPGPGGCLTGALEMPTRMACRGGRAQRPQQSGRASQRPFNLLTCLEVTAVAWVRRGQPGGLRDKEGHEPVGPRARDYAGLALPSSSEKQHQGIQDCAPRQEEAGEAAARVRPLLMPREARLQRVLAGPLSVLGSAQSVLRGDRRCFTRI